jgi:hypothetical protein
MDKLAAAMKVVGKDDSKALKGEERSDNTVKQYLIRLVKLNNDKPFTNLKFLMDKDAIANVIKDKAESTKIGYYSAIVVALSTELPDKFSTIANCDLSGTIFGKAADVTLPVPSDLLTYLASLLV